MGVKFNGEYRDARIGWNDYSISIQTNDKEVFDKFHEIMIEFHDWNKERNKRLYK